MSTLLIILLGTMLIQGSSLVSATPRSQSARGDWQRDFAGARHTLLTLTLASLWGWASRTLLTLAHAEWLLTPVVLLGTALIVASVNHLLQRALKINLHSAMDLNLTTQLTNQGASLGIAMFSAANALSFDAALAGGVGSALALSVLSACFNALRDRMELTAMPLGFRGIPIALITAGFMALALMGFAGMVRGS